eukprot:480744-Lingulodinium_polyedra.AAC.1
MDRAPHRDHQADGGEGSLPVPRWPSSRRHPRRVAEARNDLSRNGGHSFLERPIGCAPRGTGLEDPEDQ